MYELSPEKALVWCDFETQYVENKQQFISVTETNQTGKLDVYNIKNYGKLGPDALILGGQYSIVNGGDMSAADPTTIWTTAGSPLLSRQLITNAPPGLNNQYCLRITHNGTPNNQAYQPDILTITGTYRIRGWARTSQTGILASVLVGSASGGVVVANSPEWRYFDFTKIVPSGSGRWFYLLSGAQSTGQYVEFANVTCNAITAKATTYPTQLNNQKGINFVGGNNITFYLDNANKRLGNKFTAIAIANCNYKVTSGSWQIFSLLGRISNVNPYSVSFGINSGTGNVSVLQEGIAWAANGVSQNRNINSYCLTVDGTSAIGYVNASVASTLTLNSANTPAIGNMCCLNGSLYTLGGPSSANMAANYYAFVMFPAVLSQFEIKYLHNLLMKSIKM